MANLAVLACVLRMTTKQGRQLFVVFERKKVRPAEKIPAILYAYVIKT